MPALLNPQNQNKGQLQHQQSAEHAQNDVPPGRHELPPIERKTLKASRAA
jgi:hypothetical protein